MYQYSPLIPLHACVLSHWLCLTVTSWAVARPTPLSLGLSRQEYYTGLHFLFQGIFPTQRLNPCLLRGQVDSPALGHLGRPNTSAHSALSTFLTFAKLIGQKGLAGLPWLVKPDCARACVLSRFRGAQLCATLGTAASQAPPAMGFSRQEYWSGLPCPPPGDLPDPRI